MKASRVAVLALVVVAVAPGVFGAETSSPSFSYTFNDSDTSGSTLIDSVGNVNASVNGATTGKQGIIGESYSFDGSDDYLSVPDGQYTDRTGSYGFSAWIYVDDRSKDQTIVYKGSDSDTAGNYLLKFNSAENALEFQFPFVAVVVDPNSSSLDIPKNDWTHVAFSVNSSSKEVTTWVDGQKDKTSSYSTGGTTTDKTAYLGQFVTNSGSKNNFAGRMDQVDMFSEALSQSDIDTLYNNGSGREIQPAQNFTVTAEDAFDASTIQNFSVNLTGQTTGTEYNLSTTNGTITTPVLSNSSELWDVNVTGDGYNHSFFNDVNVSQDTSITASIADAFTEFDTSTVITDSTVQGEFNVTINGITQLLNTSDIVPVPEREFNATFNQETSDFYNTTETGISPACQTLSCTGASSTSATFNPYNAKLTVNLNNADTGNNVQNYTATISNTTNNYNESKTTTNGTITFNVEQNLTYNITVDSQDYPVTSRTVDVNQSTQTETFSLLEERTVKLKFRDTTSTDVITQRVNYTLTPVNIDANVVTGDTNTGAANETLLSPAQYRGQAKSTNRTTNTFYFTITDESITDVTVYLEDSTETSPVTVTVLNSATNPVQGILVSLQRFYTNQSTYKTVTQSKTNFEGQTTLFPPQDQAYYKFIFQDNQDVVDTTEPLQLLESTYKFTINLQDKELDQYNNYTALSTSLTYDNATSDFKATINQGGQRNKACLRVKQITAFKTQVINKTCTTSPTATLILPRGQQNSTYKATLTYKTSNSQFLVEQLTVSFDEQTPAAQSGLIGQILLTTIIAGPAVVLTPTLSPVFISLSVAFGYWIGLTTIGVPAVMAFITLAGLLTLTARRAL